MEHTCLVCTIYSLENGKTDQLEVFGYNLTFDTEVRGRWSWNPPPSVPGRL